MGNCVMNAMTSLFNAATSAFFFTSTSKSFSSLAPVAYTNIPIIIVID